MRYKLRSVTERLDLQMDLSTDEYFSKLKDMYEWMYDNHLRNNLPSTQRLKVLAKNWSEGDTEVIRDSREFVELSSPDLLDEFDKVIN